MSHRNNRQLPRDRNRLAANTAERPSPPRAFAERGERSRSNARPQDDDAPPRNDARRIPQRRGRRPPRRNPGPPRNQDQRPAQPELRFAAEQPTPAANSLRYSCALSGALTPYRDHFELNYTAEGYLNLMESCYVKMHRLDSRIIRSLPRPVFMLCCVQLYHTQMIRIAESTGQQANWGDQYIMADAMMQQMNLTSVQLPVELFDWLQGIGRYIDRHSMAYVCNVPLATVPKPARTERRVRLVGGDFGIPNAQSHNAYETSLAPIVYRNMITAALNNEVDGAHLRYTPLPAALMPANLAPTANLLGYDPREGPWHRETITFYAPAAMNWANGPVVSRLCYNGTLMQHFKATMGSLADKMKIVTGLPPVDKGDIACLGALVKETGNDATIVRLSDGKIESPIPLDPSSISAVMMKSYRRRRTVSSPGTCFLTAGGAVPPGWVLTMNHSYQMQGIFQPNSGNMPITPFDIQHAKQVTEGRYDQILPQLVTHTIVTSGNQRQNR